MQECQSLSIAKYEHNLYDRIMQVGIRKCNAFTIVEIIVVITVIAILATISFALYTSVKQNAAKSSAMSALTSAQKTLDIHILRKSLDLQSAMQDINTSSDLTLQLVTSDGVYYDNLTAVQNGVLFHTICLQLVTDTQYSLIHPIDGSSPQSVVMSCDDSIAGSGLQITGWETKYWSTPVTRNQIQNYINNVPYDSWWTNKQEVVRNFHTELISRFEASGGKWPITSFWDPWANMWSGVHKEGLPTPEPLNPGEYCVQAIHHSYPDKVYSITNNDTGPTEGHCV